MTRFGTKLAAGVAVFALAAFPATAAAQDTAVDEKTGPVSFANAAAFKVGDEGQPGGSVITETQRSPLKPGSSRLSQDRTLVPREAGEKNALGPNYLLTFGHYAPDQNPFPEGVPSQDHNVTAELKPTTVPDATAQANYALSDYQRGGQSPRDNTVFAIQNAKSTVDCTSNDKTSATATADKIWVRTDEGLKDVTADQNYEGHDLPFGAPIAVDKADRTQTRSDLKITKLTSFDQLLKQSAWRSGDTTVAAGWQADIVTHVKDTAGNKLQDVKTRIVLGGVSCSLPKGFVPITPAGNPAPGAPRQPDVPVKIPAGVVLPVATVPDDSSAVGFALLGGGLLLAGGAVFLARRRKPASAPETPVLEMPE
jgi:LPXTG-motif cell wall-anchored protein